MTFCLKVLQPAEQSNPASLVGYHQLLDSSLPRVPLTAARAIHARVTEMVGRALAEVDEIQAELLPPMADAYTSLSNRLGQMALEDEPNSKRPKTQTGLPTSSNGPVLREHDALATNRPRRVVLRVSTLVSLCISRHPSHAILVFLISPQPSQIRAQIM